jgi:hypothetical protein
MWSRKNSAGDVVVRHTARQWIRHTGVALLLATVLTACSSPEDGRARGGGPGADVGNKAVQFKPDSKVFE